MVKDGSEQKALDNFTKPIVLTNAHFAKIINLKKSLQKHHRIIHTWDVRRRAMHCLISYKQRGGKGQKDPRTRKGVARVVTCIIPSMCQSYRYAPAGKIPPEQESGILGRN